MNINRKRQLIRRKMKTAEAKVEALKADNSMHPLVRISTGVQIAVSAVEESRLIAMETCDPMDVLDITQIGADYPVTPSKRIDTLTKSFEKIPGCGVIGR